MANVNNTQNFKNVKNQLSAAFGNSSIVIKSLCSLVCLFYFISFTESGIRILAATPGNVLPPNFWFWTYFTHSILECHIWCVLVDIIIIVLYGKLLQPLWGDLEMILFFLVVNTGVAIFAVTTYLFIYMITRNEEFLFETHIHGLAGYVAGFSVAVKQIMPDHVIINSPFGKLRNKHIPMIMLYIAIVARIAGIVDGPYPIMFGAGLLVSWCYLRFYQKHNNGNRGDMADNFMFASFFPDAISPFIAIISNTIFIALIKLKICKKPQRKYDMASSTTITVSLPGTDPQDAERRRQLALKALNDRLSKVDSQLNWPSLDDPLDDISTHTNTETRININPSSEENTSLAVPNFKENSKTLLNVDSDSES